MSAKSFLIIGIGTFGLNLAKMLNKNNCNVTVVDINSDIIDSIKTEFNDAICADCTNENVIKELSVSNYDTCFVTIGEDFQSSLVISSYLKEFGAKYVVSKSCSDIQKKFLLSNGVDEIINPESDMAEKFATYIITENKVQGLLHISDDISISQVEVIPEWIGKAISECSIRDKYKINIIAIKKDGRNSLIPTAGYIFEANDSLIIVSKREDALKLWDTQKKPLFSF